MRRIELVPDAKHWWKRWHTYIFAVAAALPSAWNQAPWLKHALPIGVVTTLTTALVVLGYIVKMHQIAPPLPPRPTVPESKP